MDKKQEQLSDEERKRIDDVLSSFPNALDAMLRDIERIKPTCSDDDRPGVRVIRHRRKGRGR